MTEFLVPTDQLLFGGQVNVVDPIYSDGIVPKKFWVSPYGTDGDANGRPNAPFQTITFALSKCSSGRGDTIFLGPGQYAENVVVSTSNVSIIGTGSRHTGVTQIVGTGTAATNLATVYVSAPGGFRLANVELDTNGVSQAALAINSNDTGASPTATSTFYRFLVENVAVRSNDPACAFLMVGATLGEIRRCTINGPGIGIGFVGSANNNPSDLIFEDILFYNGNSNTATAFVATVQGTTAAGMAAVGAGANTLTNIAFRRPVFLGPTTGAGGVTNYINLTSTVTALNVGFFDCQFTNAPTNGTNQIATLPTNVVVLGHGTSGLVSLKG